MSESGHGAQVVKVTDDHTYELNEEELEQVLMHDEIKDLPVVVVSVAGAYRGGKSFLLNFFLRYLTSPPSDREDGSWLGEDSDPLEGFRWRSGITRTTTGILLWSEPIITLLPNGNKVAVLLMDTQGTFDSKSTVRDCSTIFALSTLLSSVQIYNLSHNIQEDDLQHLQLFTEYGKMVKAQGGKAFQVLEFLVRDWQFPEDYPYGEYGGQQFLDEKLEIQPNHAKELKDLRQHIRSSFEKVSCFLMPHPGFKVLGQHFSGNISDIDSEFRVQLIDLVNSLFSPGKLMPKTVNGEQVKARDMFNYFKTYMALFNSGTIPNPTSIMNATVEAGLLTALNEARQVYEIRMDADCGPKQLSVPAVDLQFLHTTHMTAAITTFITKKKMGTKEQAEKYLVKLKKELEQRLPQFAQSNLAKIQAAINKAKEAYEEVLQNISKDQLLCVHPLDLEKVHKAGFEAAIKTFDGARKRVTDKPDDERLQFIQSFEKRYTLLRLSNEQNNKIAVALLRIEYWQYMQVKSGIEPPLSDSEFKDEHDTASRKALEDFNSKRNIPSTYTEDIYKFNLITAINESFIQMKAMNKSMHKVAMQGAVEEYDKYIKSVLDTHRHCMHPNGLDRENQNGLCRALVKFRPKKQCSDGFDYNDDDETTLMSILRERFSDIKSLNDAANNTAVQEAFNVYVTSMDELCKPTLWWLLIIPIFIDLAKRSKYHEESKAKAKAVFSSIRLNDGMTYSSDPYMDTLDQMMENHYAKNSSGFMEAANKLLGQIKDKIPQGGSGNPENILDMISQKFM